MSISIGITAQKKVTKAEFEKVELYNKLVMSGYEIPEALEKDISVFVEYEDETINIVEDALIEIRLRYDGDVMYGEGAIIKMSDIPDGTVAIRICAYA